MTRVMELLGRLKQAWLAMSSVRWVWIIVAVILVAWGYAGVRSCTALKSQRDAAVASAQRQRELDAVLTGITVKFTEIRHQQELAEREQDTLDEQELTDLYTQMNAEGSAAGVVNDMIRAGELP